MTEASDGIADHELAFIICCDEEYASHAGTCLFSLFLSTSRRDFDVHLIANALSGSNLDRFRQLAALFGARIYIHDPGPILEILRSHNQDYLKYKLPHLSESAMLRLYYHLIIPKTYARVAYIDCDVIFRQDAFRLLSVEISDYALAAVPDLMMKRRPKSRHSSEEQFPYFNSGILLIDDSKWRHHDVVASLEDILARTDPRKLTCLDQHLLNVHFQRVGYHVLPCQYNYQYLATIDDVVCPAELPLESACVIHYAGEIKPWHEWAPEEYSAWYQVYRRSSPWGFDYQPQKPTNARHLFIGYRALAAQRRHELACSYAERLIKFLQSRTVTDK